MTTSASRLRSALLVLSFAFVLFINCHAAEADTFEGVGNLPGAAPLSGAIDVNADGSVVVGFSSSGLGLREAYRWTQAGGMVGLGDLPGGTFFSQARGTNADGSVVVGSAQSAIGTEAFRWTQAGGMVSLGRLTAGGFSEALATNADGSVVVGIAQVASGGEAFRWTQAGGMVGLGDLSGGTFYSSAADVSADGSVVVGDSRSASGGEAFRWTQAGGMVGLGDLSGGSFESRAKAVSGDGSVVVGFGTSAAGKEAFRWTQADGMVGLGDLPGGIFSSSASGVSGDGSVVVGFANSASGMEAFRWTQSTGMQSVKDMLTKNGVDMSGWTLTIATGVSADGTTIIGNGRVAGALEGFVARESGAATPQGLNDSLSAMSQVGSAAVSISQINITAMMDASHGAILNTASGLASGEEMTGRTQLWVVGSLLGDSSFSGDDFGGEGGVGLTHYLANGVSVGGGVFTGARSLDTSHGGNQKVSLVGPGVFVAYVPEATGLRIEGGGTYHYIDMDLKRGYQNGAGSAQSHGNTCGHAFGFYGRIGWAFPVADHVALQPFVQYNWQAVEIDGYTESDGPFPASFNNRNDRVNRTRLGVEAQYAYSAALDLWAWAAWDHRFENKGSSMSGQLTGLYAFNYGGGAIDQDWGDAGVGATWRPYEGFETFSRLGFGIDSQDNAEPDLALTIGLGWDL